MRLSIFTTQTNPEKRGDIHKEALACYKQLADELVIVDGGDNPSICRKDIKADTYECFPWQQWPQEFEWTQISKSFQAGYDYCTGDAVIHADLDFVFSEKDYEAIRKAAQTMLDSNAPAMSAWKWQFILPDRYNLKSRLVIMVNKRDYGSRIKFDGGGEQDLCQPSLDQKLIRPDDIPEGKFCFYNYEKICKSKSQIAEDQGRMERAWFRHFGKYQMGSDGTDESAYDRWITTQKGKFAKPQKHIALEGHPAVMAETIRNLTPEQFGHSGFGELGENDYIKASK